MEVGGAGVAGQCCPGRGLMPLHQLCESQGPSSCGAEGAVRLALCCGLLGHLCPQGPALPGPDTAACNSCHHLGSL